jgi:DNA-binding NarL/FixJ family response regulator
MCSSARPRVLLADDHAGVLTALQRLLAPSCDVVGQVTVGTSVLEEATRLRPDVVVMDISMPALSGLDACKQVKDATPDTNVIILTAATDDEIRHRAYELGASGFVLKHRVVEDLVEAIHTAMRGNRHSTQP